MTHVITNGICNTIVMRYIIILVMIIVMECVRIVVTTLINM